MRSRSPRPSMTRWRRFPSPPRTQPRPRPASAPPHAGCAALHAGPAHVVGLDAMLGRITIDAVRPRTPDGYPAKAAVGERVPVSADVFRDGHDVLAAHVRWRRAGRKHWTLEPMWLVGN